MQASPSKKVDNTSPDPSLVVEPTKQEKFGQAFSRLEQVQRFVSAGLISADDSLVADARKAAAELFDPSFVGWI